MITEIFQQSDSTIHNLDPRCKIIFAVLISITIAISNNYIAIFPTLLFAIISVPIANLPIFAILKRLLIINLFIGFIWITLPFTTKGEVIYSFWKLNITSNGLIKSGIITLKCNTIMLTLMVYVSTIPISEVGHTLSKLKLNKKLTMFILFTYRYLNVITLEFNRLHNAAKIRGFRPGTNMHTYKTYSFLIGSLLVRSWERAERVHQAMLCRGFNGNFYCLKTFELKKIDFFFCIITGFLTLYTILFNII